MHQAKLLAPLSLALLAPGGLLLGFSALLLGLKAQLLRPAR
jgi:hypothetical protein